jgi:hypothetical protein
VADDDFSFVIDGVDLAPGLRPQGGTVETIVPVKPGQLVAIEVGESCASNRIEFLANQRTMFARAACRVKGDRVWISRSFCCGYSSSTWGSPLARGSMKAG